jgi:uncharacterized protein YceK
MQMLFRTAALIIVVFLTGCASMVSHSEGPRSDIYPGFRADGYNMTHPKKAGLNPVLSGIDLPFSFVWDTLCLPLDGTAAIVGACYSEPSKSDSTTPNTAQEPTPTAP